MGLVARRQAGPVEDVHVEAATPSDRGGLLRDLEARERGGEAAVAELSQQRAVAAAHLEHALRREAEAGGQLQHVVGLPHGAERSPPREALGLLALAAIGAVVEALQVARRRHTRAQPYEQLAQP